MSIFLKRKISKKKKQQENRYNVVIVSAWIVYSFRSERFFILGSEMNKWRHLLLHKTY